MHPHVYVVGKLKQTPPWRHGALSHKLIVDSQFVPVLPYTHWHVYPLNLSIHVPPFRHGDETHSFAWYSQLIGTKQVFVLVLVKHICVLCQKHTYSQCSHLCTRNCSPHWQHFPRTHHCCSTVGICKTGSLSDSWNLRNLYLMNVTANKNKKTTLKIKQNLLERQSPDYI